MSDFLEEFGNSFRPAAPAPYDADRNAALFEHAGRQFRQEQETAASIRDSLNMNLKPEAYNFLLNGIDSGAINEEELFKMATSLNIAERYGLPVPHVMENLPAYLAGEGINTEAKMSQTVLRSVLNKLEIGKSTPRVGNLMYEWMTEVEKNGDNSKHAKMLLGEIERIEAHNASLEDAIPDEARTMRDRAKRILGAGAQTLGYTGYIMAHNLMGKAAGLGVLDLGPINAWDAGRKIEAGQEYYALRKMNIDHDIAKPLSEAHGMISSGVEQTLEKILGMGTGGLANSIIGKKMSETLIGKLTSKVFNSLQKDGFFYNLATSITGWALNIPQEFSEEFLQEGDAILFEHIATAIQQHRWDGQIAEIRNGRNDSELSDDDKEAIKALEGLKEKLAQGDWKENLGRMWEAGIEGGTAAIALGFPGAVMQTSISARDVAKARQIAVVSPSIEQYRKDTEDLSVFKNLAPENRTAAQDKVYETMRVKRESEEMERAEELKNRRLYGALDTSGDEAWRNEDKSLHMEVTRHRESGGLETFQFVAGDPRKGEKNSYAIGEAELRGEKIAITGLRIGEKYEGLRDEILQNFANDIEKPFEYEGTAYAPNGEGRSLRFGWETSPRMEQTRNAQGFNFKGHYYNTPDTEADARSKQEFTQKLKSLDTRIKTEDEARTVTDFYDHVGRKWFGMGFASFMNRMTGGSQEGWVHQELSDKEIARWIANKEGVISDAAAVQRIEKSLTDAQREEARKSIRGFAVPGADGVTKAIYAAKDADVSTFIHEGVHAFTQLAQALDPKLYSQMMEAAGFNRETYNSADAAGKERMVREAMETLAYGAEAYLREGPKTANNLSLREMYGRIKEFLKDLADALHKEKYLTPEVRNLFDNLFGDENMDSPGQQTERTTTASVETAKETTEEELEIYSDSFDDEIKNGDLPIEDRARAVVHKAGRKHSDTLLDKRDLGHRPTAELIKRAHRITDQAEKARVIAEIRELRKKYAGTSAEFMAPNGKKSLLLQSLGDEKGKEVWYVVRTEGFKKWFGDWERAARIKELEKAPDIVLNSNAYQGEYELNKDSIFNYLNKLKEKLRMRNPAIDADIRLAGKGIRKLTSWGMNNNIYKKLFAHIQEITEKSILIAVEKQNAPDAHYNKYSHLASGIQFEDGKQYTVHIILGENEGLWYYSHILLEIEKGSLLAGIQQSTPGHPTSASQTEKGNVPTVHPSTKTGQPESAPLSDIKDTTLFHLLQTDFSKIVDANGEPQAVYRGDAAGMNRFNNRQGVFFASNKEVAEKYSSGGLYDLFLDIRNPLALDEKTFNETRVQINDMMNDFIEMDESELENNSQYQALRKNYLAFRNEEGSAVRDFYNDFLPEVSEETGLEEFKEILLKSLHDAYTFEWRQIDYCDIDILNPYIQALGYDGIVRPYDPLAQAAGDEYITFEPSQIKSATENAGTFYEMDGDIYFQAYDLLNETQTEKPADINTDNFRNWFEDSKVVDENGKPLVVFHGTARPDRIGEKFDPKRATSGPMAFFTTGREIAESYAKNKSDTSLDYEGLDVYQYENWFRIKTGRGNPVPLADAWHRLPIEQREKIKKLAPRVTEEEGKIYLADEGHTNGIGNYDYEIKEKKGNAAAALIEGWLSSGTLFNDEARFTEVLKLAGFEMDNVSYHNPHAKNSAVFPVYLKISSPLDTSNINNDTFAALKEASKTAKKKRTADADMWDKNSISPKEWMEKLEEDIKSGSTFSWTRVPDWVTKTLKTLGYDGIRDTGGKYSGYDHMVWIPFASTQIKSIYNQGTFNKENPNILFQSAFHGSPHRFERFDSSHMGSGEGTQAYGWGHYFASKREVAEYYRELSGLNDAQLYEVDIPGDEEMLDLDKPFKEQPEDVRLAIYRLWRKEAVDIEFPEQKTGEDVYVALSSFFRGNKRQPRHANYQQRASLLLSRYGIKGLRFLDQHSRTKGEGSHNYVIFDDSDINITRTYYSESFRDHEFEEFINAYPEVVKEAANFESGAEMAERYAEYNAMPDEVYRKARALGFFDALARAAKEGDAGKATNVIAGVPAQKAVEALAVYGASAAQALKAATMVRTGNWKAAVEALEAQGIPRIDAEIYADTAKAFTRSEIMWLKKQADEVGKINKPRKIVQLGKKSEAVHRFFNTVVDSSKEIHGDENLEQLEADLAGEKRDAKAFIDMINTEKGYNDLVRGAWMALREESQRGETEEETQRNEKIFNRARAAFNPDRNGNWKAAFANIAAGKKVNENTKKIIRGMIRNRPLQYMEAWATITGDDTWLPNETDVQRIKRLDTEGLADEEYLERQSPEEIERIGRRLGSDRVKAKIDNKTLKMDDPDLNDYEEQLKEDMARARALIAERKEGLKQYQYYLEKAERNARKEQIVLEQMAKDTSAEGLIASREQTKKLSKARQQVKDNIADMERFMREDLTVSQRTAFVELRKQFKEQERIQAELKAIEQIRDIKKKDIRQILRRVDLKTVSTYEAKYIEWIQAHFDSYEAVAKFIRRGAKPIQQLYNEFAISAEYRETLKKKLPAMAYHQIERTVFKDLANKKVRAYAEIDARQRRSLYKHLTDYQGIFEELGIDITAEPRQFNADEWTQIRAEMKDVIPADLLYKLEGLLETDESKEKDGRTGRRFRVEDFNIEDIQTLAGIVNRLRKEGRERESARKDAREQLRLEAREKILRTLQEHMPKNAAGDGMKGIASTRLKEEKRSKWRGVWFMMHNARRFFRMLEGGVDGYLHDYITQQEYEAFNTENSHVFERREKVEKELKKIGVSVKDLVRNRFTIWNRQEVTLDEMLTFYYAQYNDRALHAVIFGNFAIQEERNALEAMAESKDIKGQAEYEAKIAKRYWGDMKKLDEFFAQEGNEKYRKVMEIIGKDFDDNYGRLKEFVAREYNEELGSERYYMPLIRLGVKAQNSNETEQALADNGLSHYINRGFTKGRVDIPSFAQQAIQAGFYANWDRMVVKQEHLMAYDHLMRDLRNIFLEDGSQTLQDTLRRGHSQEALKYIKRFISELGTPPVQEDLAAMDTMNRMMRGHYPAAVLGWRVASILKQAVESPPPFFQFVNPAEYTKAGISCLKQETRDMIYKKSVYMKARYFDPAAAVVHEMERLYLSGKLGKAEAVLAKAESLGMTGQEWIDAVCVMPGWLAAYNRKKAELNRESPGLSMEEAEAQAVRFADLVVRDCQPSSVLMDQTQLLKNFKHPLTKMFAQFQTPIATIFQNLFIDTPNNFKQGRILQGLWTWGIYALVAITIGAMHDDGDDDDDKSRWDPRKRWVDAAVMPLEMIPVIGGTASYAAETFLREGKIKVPSRTNFPVIDSGIKAANAITGEKWGKAATHMTDAFFYRTGLPAAAKADIEKAIEEGKWYRILGIR